MYKYLKNIDHVCRVYSKTYDTDHGYWKEMMRENVSCVFISCQFISVLKFGIQNYKYIAFLVYGY